MTKEKTFRILMAETHAQYYEVKAIDEDQARERIDVWEDEKEWALSKYDEGVTDSTHAKTELIEEEK